MTVTKTTLYERARNTAQMYLDNKALAEASSPLSARLFAWTHKYRRNALVTDLLKLAGRAKARDRIRTSYTRSNDGWFRIEENRQIFADAGQSVVIQAVTRNFSDDTDQTITRREQFLEFYDLQHAGMFSITHRDGAITLSPVQAMMPEQLTKAQADLNRCDLDRYVLAARGCSQQGRKLSRRYHAT